MKTIETTDLETVTGGTQTVAGRKTLDTATEQALTKLSSDIKDLARGGTNNQSQTTQMMTMMMMAKLARG
jgi:hypothetical protein